ncbi:hypothetical protein [Sulfitobacter sediminilitoris]|uniref:hypothetical protein n=1 Tax=Sulfitobacter sediminilitoris TaxID=2698830 RepID=UPI00361F01C2
MVAAAEMLFFGVGFYDQLTLHPFWIVILITAMQHGVGVAFATVVIATLLIGLPDRLVGEAASMHAARVAVLPLQWLVVALVVGLYRQKEIIKKDGLSAEVTRLEGMSESLAAEVDRMDGMVAQLEREAATRPIMQSNVEVSRRSDEIEHFRRALPELAALAGATGTDLPTTFEAAANALFETPVALLVTSQEQGTLLMGTMPDFADTPRALSDLVLAVLEKRDQAATVVFREEGIEADGAATLARRYAHIDAELSATVILFAPDVARAEASTNQVEILAEMARIAIDRLSRALEAGEDAGSASQALD